MAEVPRFPNSLRFIREHRRLSIADLANEIGTSAKRLAKIEQGTSVPTLRQFDLLSQVLGVPDFEIAGADTPRLQPILADLRTPAQVPLSISGKGLRAYFSRSATAAAIDGLARSLQIRPTISRPSGLTLSSIQRRVSEVYDLLDFDPRDSFWIDDPERAWRYLRYKIEAFGIYCFLVQVPPEDYRGLFTNITDNSHLIIVNKRTFKTKARLFTLIHEFAHFLLNLEGLSDPLIIKNDAEKACNKFASSFLAPPDLVTTLINNAGERSTGRLISYVAGRCLLSQGAVAYRLRSDGTISTADYQKWYAANGMAVDYGKESTEEELNEEDGTSGGKYAYNVVSDFGFRPLEILEKGLKQRVIDDVHVAKLINARGATQDLVFKTVNNRVAALKR